MSKTNTNHIKRANKYKKHVRKIKPYCLTGEKKNTPSYIGQISMEDAVKNQIPFSRVKTLRKQRTTERLLEKKKTRQQSKQSIIKLLQNGGQ